MPQLWSEKFKVKVPEGKSGDWTVEKFTVSLEAAKLDALEGILHGSARHARPGTYTRLMCKGGWHPVMSDTPDEIRDHLFFIHQAEGRVLINGLGLGMCVKALLGKREAREVGRKYAVQHITVIENSADVIKLVAPTLYKSYGKKRLTIIEADAFEWQPPKGERWDVVWHDIWPTLCADNLKSMAKLHRKYGRRSDWQGSWSKEECLYLRQEDRRRCYP